MLHKKPFLLLATTAFIWLMLAACRPAAIAPLEVTRVVTETIVAEAETVEVTRVVVETAVVIATPTSTPPPPTSVPRQVNPPPSPTPPPPTHTPTPTRIPPQPIPSLNINLDENFGSIRLAAGFLPDPYEVSMTSGGTVNAANLGLGANCRGYATEAPDFELTWSGQSTELRIFFTAENQGDDTTLIINDPFGNWQCNDDFENLQPGIIFPNPAEGRYDIWIGSYTSGDYIDGTLYITEHNLTPLDVVNVEVPTETVPGRLDYSLTPTFGSVSLSAGFLPDPHAVSVTSGGSVEVGSLNLGSGCYGYAATAPDFRLHWSGQSDELTIHFRPNGSEDATLIINDPNGNWLCNDDFDGLNPAIQLSNPSSGQYDVWIGSYSSGAYIDGQLRITEFDFP